MSDLNKTPQELKEIIEWYADWLLYDSVSPKSELEWLCDNVNPKTLETIVHTYEFNNK